ncbi:MAG: FtsX-like permease family protein, partial [Pirellulaceae bacterium]
ALLMVSLLFRLGIDMRASEVGTLLALGLPRRQVRGLFLREGCVVAAGGAALGVLVGVGYARLMLAGLSHWWLGAITTPFLTFHASAFSLVLGYVLGGGMCVGTIAWCLRTTRHVTIRQLLHGQTQETVYRAARGWQTWLTPVCVAAALGLSLAALRLGGMAQGGAFVASGAALLAGLLLAIRARLHSPRTPHARQWSQRHVLWRMAIRNAARNPARSLITIALMATATFLIVAMSSFRLAPTEAGTGGFELIADSSEPIYVDLDLPERRQEFFGSRARQLDGTSILGLRVRAGDDASCNNLYQATQPRILGVTPQFVAHFDQPGAVSFPWADRAADIANPWRLLADAGGEADNPAPAPSMPRPSTPGPSAAGEPPPVPVVLDKNTALYSLHLYGGVGEEFSFRYDGRPVRFRVVGLLENSVLQGSLLIAEDEFRRLFPEVSGYRFFAIATPPSQESAVSDLLEDQLGDQGLDAVPAREVLEQLLAVQNTYLSTFQSLGALGLLLGTFGLATVQLRNVLERRGELALMRATGYRRRRLAELVVYENAALLAAGLATGAVAALLAVLPHKLFGEASVSWALLRDLALMLLAVLVTGLVSSLLCVRAVLRLPLLAGLRGE